MPEKVWLRIFLKRVGTESLLYAAFKIAGGKDVFQNGYNETGARRQST